MELVEKLKSIGQSISLFLAGQAPETPEPVAALEVQDTLQDGTPLTFSPELAVGATVMSSTEAGTMPLADGEYILASGQPFTVSMGIISTLGDVPAAVAAMPALAELENTLAERLSETFKPKVTPEMITELETKLSKQTEIINDLYEAVVELSKAEPTREIVNPTPKGGFNPDTIVEALKEIKKLKNK